jgi:ribosomal protein S18 acetylase RimI-like enzyme
MEKELYFLRSSEQYLAKELLLYAAHFDETGRALEAYPSLEQYHREYGAFNGDIGVYLIAGKKAAGGAWVRLLANGFALVDHNTPELVCAVLPEFRQQGIGTLVLQQLFIEVSKIYPQVSLSVTKGSPAIALFERLGFVAVEDSEHHNAQAETAITMLKVFEEAVVPKEQKLSKLEEECFRKSFRAPY